MQAVIWRKIESSLYTGKSGKIMRKDYASFALAAYLISCQQSNHIGIFRFEPDIECTRLGMTPDKCQEALALCIESGFCQFDAEAELIYIPNYTLIQVGELKERDNRRRTLQQALAATPDHEFMKAWIKKYRPIYGEGGTNKKGSPTPTEGVPNPLATPTETLQETKKEEQKQEDTYPGEHVMGRLSEEEKAEGYAFLERQNAEAAAERERKRAELIASSEAKKQQGVANPYRTPSVTLSNPFDTPTEPLDNPLPTPTEGVPKGSDTLTAREREDKIKIREDKIREEDSSKDESDSILQTGNQPGGDLLAGAPVLPSADIGTPGDMAKVTQQLQRLGIDDDLEDGARWLAKFFGKKLGSVAIALGTIHGTFDPESEEARTVRGNIKPWQGWIAGNLPGEL